MWIFFLLIEHIISICCSGLGIFSKCLLCHIDSESNTNPSSNYPVDSLSRHTPNICTAWGKNINGSP